MKTNLQLMQILHDNIYLMCCTVKENQFAPLGLCGLSSRLKVEGKFNHIDDFHVRYLVGKVKPHLSQVYKWKRGDVDRRFYWIKSQIEIEKRLHEIDMSVDYSTIFVPDNSNPYYPTSKEILVFDKQEKGHIELLKKQAIGRHNRKKPMLNVIDDLGDKIGKIDTPKIDAADK